MATVTIYVEYLKKGAAGTIVAQDATYECEVKTQTNYDTRQQTTALVLPNPNGVFGSGTYGVAYTDSKHYGGSAYIINSTTPQYWRNWDNASAGRTSSVDTTEKGELITAQLLYTSATSGNYVIRFRVLSYHDITVDATGSPFAINVSAPFTASVAAGTKQTFTVEGEPKVTVKVAGNRSYEQYFLRYDLDGVSTGHTSASVAYSFTVSSDHTIKAVYGDHPVRRWPPRRAPRRPHTCATKTTRTPTWTARPSPWQKGKRRPSPSPRMPTRNWWWRGRSSRAWRLRRGWTTVRN